MKKVVLYTFVFIFFSSSLVTITGCKNSNTTTGADSTSTTTTDTTSTLNKMSDTTSRMMADSTKKDTGGRNTQNVPPPKK